MRAKKFFLFIVMMTCILMMFSCSKSQKPQRDEGTESPQAVENTGWPQLPQDNQVVAQFSTKILDKSSGRMINLKLGAQKINNVVVKQGTTFSFNNTVGKASEKNGFKDAVTLDGDGNKVLDDGGGICQISTTLFNAVQKAGMKIIERHSHTKGIGYVKKGQDAAIDFESMDFKFINTKNYPVKIKADVSNDKVTINIIKANM